VYESCLTVKIPLELWRITSFNVIPLRRVRLSAS
jgi:hypothetical protein